MRRAQFLHEGIGLRDGAPDMVSIRNSTRSLNQGFHRFRRSIRHANEGGYVTPVAGSSWVGKRLSVAEHPSPYGRQCLYSGEMRHKPIS